jgi:hypothetical protein
MTTSVVQWICRVVCCGAILALGGEAFGNTVIDQSNPISDGGLDVAGFQIVGQTFTVGTAGQLAGIELTFALNLTAPNVPIFLDLYDASNQLIGTLSTTTAGFLFDGIPPSLAGADVGSGYFDLRGLNVQIAVSDQMSFVVRHSQISVCNQGTGQCSPSYVPVNFCSSDQECDPVITIGSTADVYGGGSVIVNGVPITTDDLAFRTFVCDQSPCDAPPSANQGRNVISNNYGYVGVNPQQLIGQSFVPAATGLLQGIELAPLLAIPTTYRGPSTSVFLDLYDDGTGALLGTVQRTTSGFSLEDPVAFEADRVGSGYFDTSGLGIQVSPSQQLSLTLRYTPPSACTANQCVPDYNETSIFCGSSAQCAPSVALDQSANLYGFGHMTVGHQPSIPDDLLFKTFVCTQPPCGPPPLVSASIDGTGGALATIDGSVGVSIPAGALSSPTTIAVTGAQSSSFGLGDLGEAAVTIVTLEPDTATFVTPVTLQFHWTDNVLPGFVDGFTNPLLPEGELRVFRNGVPATSACADPASQAPTCTTACCDTSTNTWTLQVTHFSEYAVGRRIPAGIRTSSLKLKDDAIVPLDLGRRRLSFSSKELHGSPSGVVVPAWGSAGDPTVSGGGSLTLYNGAGGSDVVILSLPQAGWKRIGSANSPGYRYSDRANAHGPINSAVLRNGKLIVRGKGAALYPLTNAPQGSVALRIDLGSNTEMCAAAAAAAPATENDTTSTFVGAPDTPAPASCPVVPS